MCIRDRDTTGIGNLCSSLISAIRGYKSEFYSAGWYLSSGVAQGISGGGGIVRDAARRIISKALSAMRAEADEASPSKETEKIARFMDMGLVNGLEGYSHIVSRAAEGVAGEALDSTKNTLANLSTVLSEDMDTTPVIRPVMDMSNICLLYTSLSMILRTRSLPRKLLNMVTWRLCLYLPIS